MRTTILGNAINKIIFPKTAFIIFEVLTAVKTSMLVFWLVTPNRLAGKYQRFGGIYCLHLQG
jgi:hypothetical protein